MEMVTSLDLKTDYLFGVSMTDQDGNEYPAKNIDRWIQKAVDWLETELQIKIRPTAVEESHDYHITDYQQFCYIQLYQFPVISVEGLVASYAGQDIMTFPPSWIQVYKESGQLQLVPTTGSLSQVLLGQGAGVMLPLITGALSSMPHLFRVNYTTGFAADKIPGDIVDIIAMKACIGILTILGDVLFGPGVSSESLSIDGLSESVSNAQSANSSAYSARINTYKDLIKDALPALRERYKGMRLAVA